MKKVFITFSLLVLTFLISGCGCSKKNLKTVTCKMEKEFDEYNYSAEIVIIYDTDSNELISIDEKETTMSSDSTFLNNVKKFDESEYSLYFDVNNTSYSISLDNDKLIRKFYVDYSKVNTEKLLEMDSKQGVFFDENNKTNINNALDYYNENGNECK